VVGYIDFGISGVLSQYSRRHLISMTLAYARGDIEGMCEAFFRITTFDKSADIRYFHRQLKEISGGWYGVDETESRLRKSITSIMLELLLLSKASGIWPQRDVIKYIRSAIALDGLMKTLSPGLDIGRQLEQACERHIKRDAMRSLISLETLSGWFGGNARLVRDGFLRTFAMLKRAGAGPSVPSSLATRQQSSHGNAARGHCRLDGSRSAWQLSGGRRGSLPYNSPFPCCSYLHWLPGRRCGIHEYRGERRDAPLDTPSHRKSWNKKPRRNSRRCGHSRQASGCGATCKTSTTPPAGTGTCTFLFRVISGIAPRFIACGILP